MEQNSNRVLKYRHIEEPTKEILRYIDNRRKGIEYSLKTRWTKFNNACNGGIEPNALYSIVGISGSGKSSFANSLETDLFDCNPNVDFVVLSFNLEMIGAKQVGRKLSNKLSKTTSELYSGIEGIKVNDGDYNVIIEKAKEIKDYPIYYVDTPGTVEEIRNTILKFMEEPFIKGKWIVIFIDHFLLVKGSTNSESERYTVSQLQYMFVEIKKLGKITIIQLGQMNREIESSERINNPSMHFPQRKDISTSDSVYQCSDYVLVIHRPEILSIERYSTYGFPTKNMVFLHILKNRDSEPKILVFENHLKYNRLEEYDPYQFKSQSQ